MYLPVRGAAVRKHACKQRASGRLQRKQQTLASCSQGTPLPPTPMHVPDGSVSEAPCCQQAGVGKEAAKKRTKERSNPKNRKGCSNCICIHAVHRVRSIHARAACSSVAVCPCRVRR